MKHSNGTAPIRKINTLIVCHLSAPYASHSARIQAGSVMMRGAIGRSGTTRLKREGDGHTPAGRYLLLRGFFRLDRFSRTSSLVNLVPLRPSQGWCDDPASQHYNRPTDIATHCRHETLWRADPVYDVVIPTTHNERPRIVNCGSAIFFHLARPGYGPTEGCIAISREDMRKLLPRLAKKVRLIIRD